MRQAVATAGMSVGAKIKVHKASDQIEHEDFAAGSVLLKDVKVS